MKKENAILLALMLLFAAFMSIPFLVPHGGFFALFGIVPLLCMDRLADQYGIHRFWRWHYSAFVLWNAATTFWIWNATPGGCIFAILANALQMSLVFGLFRWVKKRLRGVLPYLFLAAAWIAWERYYVTAAEISWPWLVLGNAFARSIRWIQWYEFAGHLGGSLWIWTANLGIFGLMAALSDGSWQTYHSKARTAAIAGLAAVLAGPPVWSLLLWQQCKETENPLQVAVLQPNIDVYNKFTALTQAQQNVILLDELERALKELDTAQTILAVAPETFTGDILTNRVQDSPTFKRFVSFLQDYPAVQLLFGASTHDLIDASAAPSATARDRGGGLWTESHNSALVTDHSGRYEIFHKSKLVPGVELAPYPSVLCPFEDWLCKLTGETNLMGRDVGQPEITVLHCKGIPVGTAICYESVYGEYCTGYVKAGANLLAIITNDAWWGDTPGYRQHLSYASLRAIETRRDIARSANTGISALISQRGEILQQTPWRESAILLGDVNLNDRQTFFVRYGDIAGRLCVFVFALLLLAALFHRNTPQSDLPQKHKVICLKNTK